MRKKIMSIYQFGTFLTVLFVSLSCSSCREQEESSVIPPEREPEVVFQVPVPELPELDWQTVRAFNLPLNNPPHVWPEEAVFMRKSDIVLGVLLGDEARAYPWDLLSNFHAVNDYLDGQPIIVNLCEACNGGAAFLATLPDTVIDIRPRGLKNGTWYGVDFQTGSLWYPFVGEAFEGPLKGTKLERIRVYFSSWGDWIRDHPNSSVVMTSHEVKMRPHARQSRMADPSTFNPQYLKRIVRAQKNPRRSLLPGNTLVFGLIPKEGEPARAFTVESLGDTKSLVQTSLSDTPIVLLLQNRYQIGAYQRLFKGQELKFELTSKTPLVMKDQLGNRWDMWGRTLAGPNHPSELELADGYLAKWYEWIENFPETEVVKVE
ncbi:MAG: DUF3179 domain-containing (seleno)protein [Roseibacillus sp.]